MRAIDGTARTGRRRRRARAIWRSGTGLVVGRWSARRRAMGNADARSGHRRRRRSTGHRSTTRRCRPGVTRSTTAPAARPCARRSSAAARGRGRTRRGRSSDESVDVRLAEKAPAASRSNASRPPRRSTCAAIEADARSMGAGAARQYQNIRSILRHGRGVSRGALPDRPEPGHAACRSAGRSTRTWAAPTAARSATSAAFERVADRPSDDRYGTLDPGQDEPRRGPPARARAPLWKREAVVIGAATDPYQPAEGRYRLTRGCDRGAGRRRATRSRSSPAAR